MTSTGGAATVSFTAPTLAAKPVAYSGTADGQPEIFVGRRRRAGLHQRRVGLYQHNPLSDVVTLHAKAVDATGFVAGTYRIATTATCSQ